MNTVFIGGSRHISRLPREAQDRLQNIIDSKFQILVGDAAGADTAVQTHLHAKAYDRVLVYCSGERCRNNIGHWKTRNISTPEKSGFQFYAAKDREMARQADFGLMIWDGKSPGTVLNVLRLLRAGKKAVLLDTPKHQAITFKDLKDWSTFLTQLDEDLTRDLRTRATCDEWADDDSPMQSDLLAPSRDLRPVETVDRKTQRALEQALESADSRAILELLGGLARKHGMSELARECGLARESLYRSLDREGHPEFGTVLKVMEAMGLKLGLHGCRVPDT